MLTFIDPRELRYAELFFHVLAHVAETRSLPASVYSGRYVRWCEARLGAAAPRLGRTLGEDARLLGAHFATHEELARLQPLARLFRSLPRLELNEGRALSDLTDDDVDEPWALAHLRELGGRAELAFCALLLELPFFATLPIPPAVPEALSRRVASLVAVAPGLSSARIGCVRSLHLRGRAWGDELWIGHPGSEVAPSIEHAAWQAAHEATVVEVSREQGELAERDVEGEAVVRLARRAAAGGEGAGHAMWLESLVTRDEASP